jgi:hypothetical protein
MEARILCLQDLQVFTLTPQSLLMKNVVTILGFLTYNMLEHFTARRSSMSSSSMMFVQFYEN